MYQHGNFISSFNKGTKKLVREDERALLKTSRQGLSGVFSETCLIIYLST